MKSAPCAVCPLASLIIWCSAASRFVQVTMVVRGMVTVAGWNAKFWIEIGTPGTAVVWAGVEVVTVVSTVPGVLVGMEVAITVVGGAVVEAGEVAGAVGTVGTVVGGVVPPGEVVHPAVTKRRKRIVTL